MTPAAAGGITMYREGQPFTAASSNTLASQVDEIQYGADEGPCLHSVRTGVEVRIDDLVEDERWPRYRPHASSIVSHSVIDQAIGILMAQQRCTATTAFNLLRTASQHRNRKLREIAADIITNVSAEPPRPRPGFRLPHEPSDEGRPV